jgi:hypothetical protein
MNEVAELELPTQENIRTDLRSVFQGAIRVALELILEEEIRSMVGAKRWERHRAGGPLPPARRPAEALERHAPPLVDLHPLALEEGALHRRPHRVEDGDGGHPARPAAQHPLPGDAVARAPQRREGIAHLPRRPRLPGEQRHLAVGGDAAGRDARNHPVIGLPSRRGGPPTRHPARGGPVSLANHPFVITLAK